MVMFTSKNLKSLSLLTLVALFLFTGCKKEETTDTTISYLRVINAVPSLATYNVYLSGTALNSAALPFAGATSYGSHAPGTYSLKFTTASSTEGLFTKSISLNQSSYQSFYLINRPNALDNLLISDDYGTTASDKAYIRFINLSPDAPAMDLLKTDATTSYTTGKTYKTFSGFIAVDPGKFTLSTKITSSGVVKAISESVTFAAGFHYDVICGGLVAPANDTERPLSLTVKLIQ